MWPLYLIVILFVLFLMGLGDARLPLLLSFALAYLAFPVIKKLEEWKIRRELALASTFIMTVLVVIILGIFILPSLFRDLRDLVMSLPTFLDGALQRLEIWLAEWGINWHLDRASLVDAFKQKASNLDAQIFGDITGLVQMAASRVLNSVLAILNLFLIPVFFVFLVMDFEGLTKKMRDIIPPRWKAPASDWAQKLNRVLSGFIRGQLAVALLLAVLYSTALSLTGIPFAIILGIVTGLLSIIPYFGFSLGVVLSLGIVLADFSWTRLVGVLIALMSVQALESFYLTPKIVGDKVGLNSLEALLALIFFGNVFGFFGMLIAIPSAGIVKMILIEGTKSYRRSTLYQE